MSRSRRILRRVVAAIVLATSVMAGMYVSARFAPARLRMEVERQVTLASGAPCRVESLRVRPGLPIEVEGLGVTLWDGALTLRRASARVSIAAALVGEVRLSRLEIEGAVLSVGRGGGGAASWPWTTAEEAATPTLEAPDDLLASLYDGVAAALGALQVTDNLVVRGGRVDVAPDPASQERGFTFEDVHVRIAQSRLRGDSSLVAQTRIRAAGEHRGLIEWNGTRRRDAPLRLTIAATELDLAWLGGLEPEDFQRPGGRLSGVADVELTSREQALVELDLVANDFGWHLAGARDPLFGVSRVSARGSVAIEPGKLSMRGARIEAGPVDAALDMTLERPIRPESKLALDVRGSEMSVKDFLAVVASMPAPWVDDASEALEVFDGGRVVSYAARSRARLETWSEATTEDVRGLPPGLRLSARLEDLRIQLDGDDVIEGLALRAAWEKDRVTLRDVVARRGDLDLPGLDLALEGVSHLLDADLDERVPDTDDVGLAGLPLLISLFEPDPGSDATSPRIDVKLARLDHPALLWPVRALDVGFHESEEWLVGDVRSGTWAGVPLHGTLTWKGEPKHLVADLVAGPRGDAPAVPEVAATPDPEREGLPLDGSVWASGSFEIGRLETDVWSHRALRGRVRAAKSWVAFDDIDAEMLPRGRLVGSGVLDLGTGTALPYRVVFEAEDLDADTVFSQFDLGRGLVEGHVAARGDLRGRYERALHPSAALSGRVDVTARDGLVRHELPAVLALTLAGERIDFRSERDFVRYTRCESRFELEEGVARTDALEFEGPDLRMLGSGSLDLGHPPHAIDAEVVVFLFRPVDRVLGAVPIVGDLILGGGDNLFAAYFDLDGPWDAPTASSRPLRTLNTGLLRLVTGLPAALRRGLESLGGDGEGGVGEPQPGAEPAPPGKAEAP